VSEVLRKSLLGADIGGMRQHCAQCLAEVYGNGKQAPTGDTLCRSCYSALWGPSATEELRSLVRLHTGRRIRTASAAVAR
jgi:hypothetical protein